MSLDSFADRSVVERPRSKQRSKVTNGKTPFVEADQRGPWARRWRDVLQQIVTDLSGPDGLSEGQRQLARRAATLAIQCERLEGEAAAGADIDISEYSLLTSTLVRVVSRLGISRIARDVTPSLADIMREHQP